MNEGNEVHADDEALAIHRQATQQATENLKVAIHEAHTRLKEELLVGVDPLKVSKRFTIDISGVGMNVVVDDFSEK